MAFPRVLSRLLIAAGLASCSVYGEDLLEPGSGGGSSGKSTGAVGGGGNGAGGGTGGAGSVSSAASTSDSSSMAPASTSSGLGGDGGGGGVVGTDAWINEIHYDNDGGDVGEGVEVAGSAGLDLSGWSLVAYNGSNGMMSTAGGALLLSGTIPNQMNGFGTRWFAMPGLENGPPDGVALVNDTAVVVQLLSWEGTFTATGGPAQGTPSEGLPVAEEPAPEPGMSLQLTGSGSTYADFTWAGDVAATPDQINVGQSFP